MQGALGVDGATTTSAFFHATPLSMLIRRGSSQNATPDTTSAVKMPLSRLTKYHTLCERSIIISEMSHGECVHC
jgi:hypothetical protein